MDYDKNDVDMAKWLNDGRDPSQSESLFSGISSVSTNFGTFLSKGGVLSIKEFESEVEDKREKELFRELQFRDLKQNIQPKTMRVIFQVKRIKIISNAISQDLQCIFQIRPFDYKKALKDKLKNNLSI